MVNVHVGSSVFDVEIEEQYVSDFRVWLKFVDGSYGVLELESGVSFYPYTVTEMYEYAKGTDAEDYLLNDPDSWLMNDYRSILENLVDSVYGNG